MPEGIDKGLLEEYIATANSGKYKSMAEVNAKFPELKDYSPDLLEEYVATANSGKYKTLDEVNLKFPEFSTSAKPAVPSFSTDMSNTNTLPVMKNSPLQANVDKPVKVATPTYIDPTKVLKTKDVVDINAEKAPKTMAQIDEESRINMQNRKIFTLTQRGLDESIEYQNLLVKKQAKELGYTDDNSLKGTTAVQKLANDKQEGWREKYLETEELAQVRAFDDYQVFKEQGKEKESNEALQKYLKSRTDYRKGIDNDIVALKGELASAEGDDAVLIRATIAELEAKKLPFYDPKKQMESFLTENETDVAAVSKPTETAQEKLKKYILAQDNLVSNLRNRLGITGKNNSFQRFTDEWKVLQGDRRQKDDLELLHNTELKVKNAVQILELNRTPLDKDSAWGVLAKEFVGELIPMKKGFSGIDNTIAANIGSIVQDADITYAANEKQVETAKFASNQYQFGSAKWVSQNLAPTLAIMVEMIPATILTEGLGSAGYLSRLSRPLKILAERGSLGAAGGTFFKVIQANKYGRGLLKAAASGVGYGIESQAVTMLAPQLKDEMGFSNGLFAGTVGSVAGQLTGKVMETSLKSIATLFGNKAPQAIAAIEKYGSVIAKTKEFSNTVAGETVEEYGEQLMSIYKESDNYKNFIYNLKKHYETTDALEEFATILMMSVGAPAGSTLGKSLFSASKKAYNNLSRKERETASRMADEIHNEVNLAMDDAANQTIRDENIQVPTRNVEEQDSAILQKQKDLKLPTAPEVVISDVSKAAMAKMENGEALTIEELKELSNELYQRYNGISATKDQDNRQFTTEQINETLTKLENNITLLENSKNKLEESGETSIVINPKEAVTQEAKPVTSAPNTKFYQGVDFKAQTGLPNGDYTEEQVKAAREAKLKKEGVPPAEIETINAEQEIIPATEAPAAPISGVSGEVQTSGDVAQEKTTDQIYAENAKKAFIDGKINSFQLGIDGLYLITNGVRVINGFKDNGNMEAFEASKVELTKEEKKELRQIEADRELGESGTGDRKRELAKKIFRRSLLEQSQNQTTNEQQNDKENGTGVQSNIGEGKEPIKTKPNETTGGEKIEAGGNVQASEEEVVKPIAEQKAEAGSVGVGGEIDEPKAYAEATDAYKATELGSSEDAKNKKQALVEQAETEEGKKFVESEVSKLEKNEDGTITVFRSGTLQEGHNPATTSRKTAEIIASERKKQGLSSDIIEVKVNPSDISVVVKGIESEVFVKVDKNNKKRLQQNTTQKQKTKTELLAEKDELQKELNETKETNDRINKAFNDGTFKFGENVFKDADKKQKAKIKNLEWQLSKVEQSLKETPKAETKPTTKAESFFNDADKLFPNDHVLGGYAVTNSEGTLIGRIQLSEVNDNTVKIDEIVSEKRGQRTGNGTAIMNKVIENADKNNVTLVLTANLIGEMKAKGFETPQKLQAFYEKFGFVKDKSKGTMVRVPKAETTKVTPKEGDTKEQAPVAKTTSVYVAPFYDAMVKTTEEANDVEKSPAYKKYVQTINSVAEALGIKIKSLATNIGAYTNDDGVKVREVSTKVELETTNIDEATEFAVLMGALAPEVQESTIAAQGLSKEDVGTKKHTGNLIVVKVDNLEEAIAIAKEIGLDHTINLKENTIDFIAFNYFSKNAKELFKRNLGRFAIKIKEKGINYETKSKPIESRFIQSGADPKSDFGRKDVLERMAGLLERANGDNGSDMGLLGRRKMLRDAIQEATRRNNEFIRQQELASERAEYGKLRTKQMELEKNGERLSDEEIKRFTELLDILIPSTQETITNASEDYEEARKELEKVAAKVIGDLGFLSTFGIKRAERAATKILRWYKGKAQWLGDGARTNLIAYSEKDVMVIYKKLQAQFKGGIIRNETKPTGLGYPKKLLEVRTSNGKIAEFQVMTPEGYLAKDGVNGFPKEKRDFAAKELAKIQKRLGWLIPDGVGHYFYEIERDFNVPTDLRERAKAISLKYYDAFLKADSKYTEKEFLDEISQFKKDVDAADKTNWDKGNNGISPVTVNDFIEDTNNQYEPISVSDTSHDTFTKDNAIDYEEDEKEGDNGRSYTYLASVTVSLVDDVSGETIGSITKLKDEYGDVTWSAEDSEGSEVADNVGTKVEAQRALVEQHNKQKAKEFNKEKAIAIKERTKERIKEAEKAAKAKEKAEKEAAKAKEKAAKEQAPVVKEQAAPPVKAEEKEDKEQKEPVKEQTEKEKAKEKAKEALRAKAAKINADVISAAQKVQQALEATGITVEVIDNDQDFQDKLDSEGVKRGSASEATGVFISKSGKIFINASKVDAKWGSVDVWHEGTHPIINIIRNTNPKLYKSIIDGLNELVASNPEIAAVVEWAQSNYEGENTLEDETITETIARIANGNIDLSKIPTSLKDKIIDFINGIAKSLGLKPILKGSNIATFKKLAKEISAALREGKDISGIVGMDNVKNFENLRNEDGSDFDQFKISNKFRNLISGLTFEYESDSQNFKDLVKKGKITNNKVLSDFEDVFVMLHVPDNAFTGFIYKDGEVLVEGKGGVYFPIKFNEEGYFWASTEAGVDKLVDVLNKTRAANKDKDGKVRLALISSRAQKIMSSTNASNNMIEILFSKAFDKRARLSEAQVKRAIFNASNEIQALFQEDYDKKIKELESKIKSADNKINKKIEVSKNEKEKRSAEKSLKSAKASGAVQAPVFNLKESAASYKSKLAIFNNVDNSSFEERKLFNELTLKNIRDLINEEDDRLNKGDKKKERQIAQEILTFLGQGKESIKFKTSGGRLSTANLIAGFSDLLGEPTLKGENANNIYAILEIDTDVEKVRIDDAHGSYPFAVKGKEGSSIVLHMLQDRRNWQQNVLDPETNAPIGKEEIIDKENGEPKTYEKRITEILPPTAGITFEPIKISTKSQPQLSKGGRDVQPVVDMIKESQDEGELTDKEIAETLEEYFPKEDIQAAFDLINNPTTATEEAEFTPSAKDIKAFEKILETTSGAIRNKNIAEAVKVNPKIQEIMDNFEDLKKQLMASVELTTDCSW